MIDTNLEDDLMKEISKDLAAGAQFPDTWVYDSIKAKISLVITRVYQEGQRDAFLAMGSFMKHQK